jgi:hypothetical protein
MIYCYDIFKYTLIGSKKNVKQKTLWLKNIKTTSALIHFNKQLMLCHTKERFTFDEELYVCTTVFFA